MKPGKIYRINWQAFHESEDIQSFVDISDNDNLIDDGDTAEIINLIGSGVPGNLSVIDNNEDPYTPILSQQLTMEFESTSNVDMSTFASGSDQRWGVHYYIGSDTNTLFKGFLVLDDISEDLLPFPNTVTLTATDGLGLLKDIPLTDFDGDTPTGKLRMITYLAYCLNSTGLALPIQVVNNIRRGSGSITVSDVNTIFDAPHTIITGASRFRFFYVGQIITISGTASNNGTFTVTAVGSGIVTLITVAETIVDEASVADVTFTDTGSAYHLYDQTYLDAKTFEDEIGTCENCYSVLTKILGESCRLFQMKGQWWILRVDEVQGATAGLVVASYNSSGSFIEFLPEQSFVKEIGTGKSILLSEESSRATVTRPHKSVRLIFNYETPREVPCNISFIRGDVITDVFPEKTYSVSCWTLREGVPGYYGTVDGTTATIHKLYDKNDYETERYVVLTPRTSFETSSINDATYLESEAIPIEVKDKFSTSISWRNGTDISTGGNGQARLFRCVLNGDDGSWWIVGEDTIGDGIPKWFDTANWTLFSSKGSVSVDFDEDDTEWRTITWEAPAAPVSGNVYLWLNQFNQLNSSDDNVDVWYNNLSFDYYPFINGSYQRYQGQAHKTNQSGNYKAKRENEVYISDSPKKLFKGGLFAFTGSAFVLVNSFFDAAKYPAGGEANVFPYGEIQLFDVWNQFRKEMRIIQATMQGCDLDLQDGDGFPDTAHLINKWKLTDPSENLISRFFLALHFNQNHDNQGWTAVFREVFNLLVEKDYSNHEFKYIE